MTRPFRYASLVPDGFVAEPVDILCGKTWTIPVIVSRLPGEPECYGLSLVVPSRRTRYTSLLRTRLRQVYCGRPSVFLPACSGLEGMRSCAEFVTLMVLRQRLYLLPLPYQAFIVLPKPNEFFEVSLPFSRSLLIHLEEWFVSSSRWISRPSKPLSV